MEVQVHAGLAFLAGVVSFLSPCILPLIPAYVSILTGTSLGSTQQGEPTRKAPIANTIGFVLGFSVVFVALGVVFASGFGLAGPATSIVNWVAGGIVILLGLNFIFDFWSFLSFEKRFQVRKTPTNAVSSGLFGMAFAAGWSPCIGPILSSILLLAGSTGSAGRGVLLLSLYSLGLGLPFLLAGFFSARVLPGLQKLKPYLPAIKTASGVLLVGLGLLILSGALQQFNTTLFSAAYSLQQWEQAHPMAARIIMGASLLVIAGLLAVLYLRRLQKDGALGPDPVKGSAPQPGGTQVAQAQARRVRPVRIGFIAAFAAVSVLTFAGVIDFSAFLAAWLNFQGI